MNEHPPQQSANGRYDVRTHRILVLSLGASVLLCVLSIAIITIMGMEAPSSLVALASTALGALVGMLAAVMRPTGSSG